MIDEMCSLQSNGIWDLVSLSLGKSTAGCHWLFIIKVGPDGTIDRFKARLVAKGYSKKEGVNYNEIFSPVVQHTSIRVSLALVAILDMELEQVNVKTTFLDGKLEEDILMQQP